MRLFFPRAIGAAVIAAACAAACGGDSGGSGVDSGVNPSTTANTASPSDAQKVCNAIANYAASQIDGALIRRTTCLELTLARALTGNPPTVAECNDSVSQCVGNTEPPAQGANGQTRIDPVSCTGTVVPPNCTATVGEIQVCATAAVDATKNYLNGLSCDLWGLAPADAQARLSATPATPAECAAVQQKCPALLTTGSS